MFLWFESERRTDLYNLTSITTQLLLFATGSDRAVCDSKDNDVEFPCAKPFVFTESYPDLTLFPVPRTFLDLVSVNEVLDCPTAFRKHIYWHIFIGNETGKPSKGPAFVRANLYSF